MTTTLTNDITSNEASQSQYRQQQGYAGSERLEPLVSKKSLQLAKKDILSILRIKNVAHILNVEREQLL